MKIWTDKSGKKLTLKQFFKRWGEGIEGLKPQQKIKSQLLGTKLILLGITLGLIMSLIGWKHLWWVAIILLGALINTTVQYLGLRQQIKVFKDIEKQLEGGNEK